MRFFLGPELLERVPDTCVAVVVAENVDPARGAESIRAQLDEAAEATKAATHRSSRSIAARLERTGFGTRRVILISA